MTNTFTIDLVGYDALTKTIAHLAHNMPKISSEVMYKWVQGTRAILKSTPYPGKNTQRMRWASDKQRRYVMAAIRRGEIIVPYRRSGTLASSWRAARTPNGATITNSKYYAHYVVGDSAGGGQYWMHSGRWWKATEIINNEIPKLYRMLAAEIAKHWKAGAL